jgi:hypothetical protein
LKYLGHVGRGLEIAEVNVNVGVIQLEDSVPVAYVQQFGAPAEDFDVVLRHRPSSMPQAVPHHCDASGTARALARAPDGLARIRLSAATPDHSLGHAPPSDPRSPVRGQQSSAQAPGSPRTPSKYPGARQFPARRPQIRSGNLAPFVSVLHDTQRHSTTLTLPALSLHRSGIWL